MNINELLGKAAIEAVSKATDEAIAADLPNADVERLWDTFRAELRGKEIRPAIQAATDPLDAKAVLIAKLQIISAKAGALVPILKKVKEDAEVLITSLGSRQIG